MGTVDWVCVVIVDGLFVVVKAGVVEVEMEVVEVEAVVIVVGAVVVGVSHPIKQSSTSSLVSSPGPLIQQRQASM